MLVLAISHKVLESRPHSESNTLSFPVAGESECNITPCTDSNLMWVCMKKVLEKMNPAKKFYKFF